MTSLARAVAGGRSGVYRLDPGKLGELATLARAAGLGLHRVDVSGAQDKPAILAALSTELRFPAWVGDNWDALQDALCDLSWLPGSRGIVLVLDGIERIHGTAPGELEVLLDVLSSTATYWGGVNRPFLALVTGPSTPALPALR
jgi:barstar (barnase inhibitor)